MVDLARSGDDFVSISDIALRQKISQKYLEKIISMLVKSGLVLSMRGASGGYKLARTAEQYNVKEILDATHFLLQSVLLGSPFGRAVGNAD